MLEQNSEEKEMTAKSKEDQLKKKKDEKAQFLEKFNEEVKMKRMETHIKNHNAFVVHVNKQKHI